MQEWKEILLQGDQIGRIDYWVIVYFGHFLKMKEVAKFLAAFFHAKNGALFLILKNELNFGRFFSQTHLVILSPP
jgi:hypothetical protein